jgi:glutamate synthase domain-containing protein 2
MSSRGGGPDFITIDGGEGGTGAAPLSFTDHVALPFRWGFSRVYREFARAGLVDDIAFIGSGKLGLPEAALTAMAMGCDMVNVGRTALLSIGCIQSQRCHTDRCPTGVATQNPRLARGLDPSLKSVRCANYIATLRFELLRLARACGVDHPALVSADQIELLGDGWGSTSLREVIGYEPGWGLPSESQCNDMCRLMAQPLK